jgi:hypothetical protein
MQTQPRLYIRSSKSSKAFPIPHRTDDKAEYDFQQLKGALISDQALDLPIQDKFQLYVYEKGGVALGVRTQLHGPILQPVAI